MNPRHAEDPQLRTGDIHGSGFQNPWQSGGQSCDEQDGGDIAAFSCTAQCAEFFKTVDQQRQRKKTHAAPEKKDGNEERDMHDRGHLSSGGLFRREDQNLPAQHGKKHESHELKQGIKKLLQTCREFGVEKINGDMSVAAGNDNHAADGKQPHHEFLNFKSPGEICSGMAQHDIQRHGDCQQYQGSRAQSQSCF